MAKYVVIGFSLDYSVNDDPALPCRSIVWVRDETCPEQALSFGAHMEAVMEEYRGTDREYDEVQVVEMEA